ncbi:MULTISPECIES: hypothetical protein [Actinomycetes]|uniref:hypothetical protein n=1 Tax=Actinomycetes TaxID=1760 RepID=UPI00281187C5|nr:hypothetical protein [Streptomyces sp.]
MHARITTYDSGYPEDYDAGLAALRAEIAPQIQALPGYRGSLSLLDRATGRSLSITFWKDADAVAATRATAAQIRERAAATSGSRIVEVVEYEVCLTDVPIPPAGGPGIPPPP